jgi:hypothetical protein
MFDAMNKPTETLVMVTDMEDFLVLCADGIQLRTCALVLKLLKASENTKGHNMTQTDLSLTDALAELNNTVMVIVIGLEINVANTISFQ